MQVFRSATPVPRCFLQINVGTLLLQISLKGVVIHVFLHLSDAIIRWEPSTTNLRHSQGASEFEKTAVKENPTDGGAWWAAVHGVAKSWTRLSDFTFTFQFPLLCTGEGNGNPLQCSHLENPGDGGAWWAAVYGVTQSWTWLKWLSSSSSC